MIVGPKSEIDLILVTKIEFQRRQTDNSLYLKDSWLVAKHLTCLQLCEGDLLDVSTL